MKTTEQLVRELADREAIRDLPVRYCDYLCRNDVKGCLSLFTDDGTFFAKDPENEVTARGRTELKKMFENAIREVHPRHFIHTHVINLRSGQSATGRCYVELRSAKVGLEWIGSGYYEDEYVKVGEDWKFASRRLTEFEMAISLRTFKAK